MNMGEKITLLRRRRNLSQADLASRTGMAQTRISGIESGKSRGFGDQIKSIADALEVPVEYLLDDTWQTISDEEIEKGIRVLRMVRELGPDESYDRLILKPIKVEEWHSPLPRDKTDRADK